MKARTITLEMYKAPNMTISYNKRNIDMAIRLFQIGLATRVTTWDYTYTNIGTIDKTTVMLYRKEGNNDK